MANEIPSGNQTKDIQEQIAGAREGIKGVIDKGTERASHLKDAAVERAGQYKDAAMERASHYRDVAMDRGKSALSTVERTIEERPLLVLGGVFAGGLILGMLLSRK